MNNVGTCRSCNKTIRWFKTAAGKNFPVNAETTLPEDTKFDGKRHVPHFATCPNANQHRRPTQ